MKATRNQFQQELILLSEINQDMAIFEFNLKHQIDLPGKFQDEGLKIS